MLRAPAPGRSLVPSTSEAGRVPKEAIFHPLAPPPRPGPLTPARALTQLCWKRFREIQGDTTSFIYLFWGHFAFIGISGFLLTARLEIREADDFQMRKGNDKQTTRNAPKSGVKAVAAKNITKVFTLPLFEQCLLHRKV